MGKVIVKLIFKDGKSITNSLAGDKSTVEAMVSGKIWNGVGVRVAETKKSVDTITPKVNCRHTTYILKNSKDQSIYVNFIGKSNDAELDTLGESVTAFGSHKILRGVAVKNSPFPV